MAPEQAVSTKASLHTHPLLFYSIPHSNRTPGNDEATQLFLIFRKALHQLTFSWTEQPESQVPSSLVLDTAARWRAPITARHAIGFHLQWRRQVWNGTHLRLFTQVLLSFMESYLLVFSKRTSPFPQLQLPTRGLGPPSDWQQQTAADARASLGT